MPDDKVRFDIQIEALAAIEQLKQMAAGAKNAEEAVSKFSNFLLQQSKKWNLSLQETRNIFKSLDAELRKGGGGGVFENIAGGSQAIFKTEEAYTAAAESAGRFTTNNEGVVKSLSGTSGAMNNASKSTEGFHHSIDLVRTALGTLAAVGIFQIMNLIQASFSEASKAARELEASLYRLSNVERILSKQGIEISTSGLKQGIEDIKKLFPIFSKEDVTQLVAQVAISTKDLGLTEKQIIDLSKAIAVLNVRSTENETATQTAQKVISSLITGNAKGVATLGVSFSEATVKAKGLELGILKAGQSLSDLNDEQKGQIKLALLLQNTGQEISSIGDYLDTNDAKLQENAASWHDLLANAGQFLNTVTPLFTPMIKFADGAVSAFKALVIVTDVLKNSFANIQKAFFSTANPIDRVKNIVQSLKDIPSIFNQIASTEVPKLFPTMPDNAPDWFKKLFGKYIDAADEADTATANFQSKIDEIDTSKAQDELEKLLKDLADLQKQMAEKEADFQTKLQRFDEDGARERENIVEDYNLNVAQTIRAFNLKQKEANDKYRRKELDDEAKFQEQMRQLREKFLYDLEDALRERDAKQVLRLIDKYNMEKTALENENALKKKQDAEDKAEQEKHDKDELAEKLRTMAEDEAVRLQRHDEEQAIKRQRMEEDHQVEMQRLKEQVDEKLRDAADSIAKEYGLNAEGADALYKLLKQYYGSDGSLAKLTAEGYNAMLQQSSGFLSQLVALITQYQAIMQNAMAIAVPGGLSNPSTTTGAYSQGLGTTSLGTYAGGLAEGGQFVATRPTMFQAGEGGQPELITVTPLSQIASLKSGSNGMNGMNGTDGRNGTNKIELAVNLSPGLEAEIVNRAMDGTADIVERINRSKV